MGTPRQGVDVNPARVRRARRDAGLSLAELAGDDVSRVFIHLVEKGKSRPSRRVLALIARRTRKPIRYFLQLSAADSPETALAKELASVGNRLRHYMNRTALTPSEKDALEGVLTALAKGVELARSVQDRLRHSGVAVLPLVPILVFWLQFWAVPTPD